MSMAVTESLQFDLANHYPVHRIGYGAMRIPGRGVWGEPKDPNAIRAVLKRAIDLGVNVIDTAAFYGPEVANRFIAETLFPYKKDLVLVSKVGARRPSRQEWTPSLTPEDIREAIDDNLAQLKVDQIHLVHCRFMEDNAVPFNESVAALAQLQQEGKVAHLGVSNVTFEQFESARKVAKIESVQNLYNITDRQNEAILDVCTAENIAFMPFFPLASGLSDTESEPITNIAQRLDKTPAQIALAWILHKSPATILIPGTSSVAHLEENMAVADIALTKDDMSALERIPQKPTQIRV